MHECQGDAAHDHALIAAHQRMLEDLQEGQREILRKLEDLPVILSEVKRTNGRVTSLEQTSIGRERQLAKIETTQDELKRNHQENREDIDKADSSGVRTTLRLSLFAGGVLTAFFFGWLCGLSVLFIGHLREDVVRTPADVHSVLPSR